MTSPTDDEVRAMVEHTEYLADFYANHGAYHSDKEVAEGFRSAATMLSRLLAERAEARKANMSDEITTLREQLATVLRREADTIVRHDKRVEALEDALSALRAENERLREALLDAVAHLAGAASAYRMHAARHNTLRPRARADPFFTTRADDFDRAVERSRAVLGGE